MWLIGLVILALMIALYKREAITEAFFSATASLGLRVEDVKIKGRVLSDINKLSQYLAVPDDNYSILKYDIAEAKRNLQTLPWVKEVSIAKQLPSTIIVSIVEKKPVFIWHNSKEQFLLLDQSYQTIKEVTPDGKYTIVSGEKVLQNLDSLAFILSFHPELNEQIASAVWVGKRRWNIYLKNGVEVRLPENNPELVWQELGNKHKDKGLFHSNIKRIDARLPDRIFIKN